MVFDAEPPVGDLRFRATVPLVNATYYPNFCIQGISGAGDTGRAGSEGCLKVNVYPLYGPRRRQPWINKSPNVTIVSVYYRLDSFGFLTTPEFADARKWIKSYISKFGSDPTKVTINGQSAGGSFVELHMIANEGEQLFLVLLRRVSSGRLFPLLDKCGTGSVAEYMPPSVSALAQAHDAAALTDALVFATDGWQLLVVRSHPPTRLFDGANVSRMSHLRYIPMLIGTPNPTGIDVISHAAENWMVFDGTNTGRSPNSRLLPNDRLLAFRLWERYTEYNAVRMVLMHDPQNLTTNNQMSDACTMRESVECLTT
ncbi:alpha/beta-hydrolase [Suillus decipiens]|nr:alpha/beta-hydrolase [Suillus decipiens]